MFFVFKYLLFYFCKKYQKTYIIKSMNSIETYNRELELTNRLNILETRFKFLIDEFDYYLKIKNISKEYLTENLLIYTSTAFKKEIEISLNNNACEVSVTHLIDNLSYEDDYNYIPITFLNKTKEDDNSHYKFIPWSVGEEKVILNIKEKIYEFEHFFKSDYWFTKEQIDNFWINTLNFKPRKVRNDDSASKVIELELIQYFKENNFQLVERSWELPSFMKNNLYDMFIYDKNGTRIIYKNVDWRDYYYIYEFKINDKVVFEDNFSGQLKNTEFIKNVVDKIKIECNKII